MADKNFTPEDKLLKIIEGEHKDDKSIAQFSQKRQKQAVFNKSQIIAFIKSIKLRKPKFKKFSWNFRLLNSILIIAAIFLTAFFIFDFAKDKMRLKKRFSLMREGSEFEEKKEAEIFPAKTNLQSILESAASKNIFAFKPVASGGIEAKVSEEEKSKFGLVGILWSKNPQVMIEDTKAQRTYLLSEGDKLDKWKVEKIDKESVILISGEVEWELK